MSTPTVTPITRKLEPVAHDPFIDDLRPVVVTRPRPVDEKGAIASALRREVWPLLERGAVKPIIYRTFPLAEAAAAHRLMELSEHVGKIVLIC